MGAKLLSKGVQIQHYLVNFQQKVIIYHLGTLLILCGLSARRHTFYSSLTFGVIVLHVTLRLIADLSSPFLSLFADWSCLSFLQNVV